MLFIHPTIYFHLLKIWNYLALRWFMARIMMRFTPLFGWTEGVMKVKYRKGRVQYSSLQMAGVIFYWKEVCFKSVAKWASKETMVSFFKTLRDLLITQPISWYTRPGNLLPMFGGLVKNWGTPSSLIQQGRKRSCQKSPALGRKPWVFFRLCFYLHLWVAFWMQKKTRDSDKEQSKN